jgi:hypothetical protein
LDCGGDCATCAEAGDCKKCAPGQKCLVGADCTSGVCTGNLCQLPTCSDVVKNGDETDIDCGGPSFRCPRCDATRSCTTGTDCKSGLCTGGVCRPGINYAYYEGSDAAKSPMPDFSALTPKATGLQANFTLENRQTSTYFSFRFTGYIDISAAGTYTFFLNSDDGSRLYIGSTRVVNNDSNHPAREYSGQITLSVGKHPITVEYFQGSGSSLLEVRYQGPSFTKRLIPDGALFPAQ